MPMIGQASGGFTESSSALRLLHVGVRNTVCALTPDGFTQTNPPIVTAAGTISLAVGMKPTTRGILSGSVAFMRPDVGSNYVGGPVTVAVPVDGGDRHAKSAHLVQHELGDHVAAMHDAVRLEPVEQGHGFPHLVQPVVRIRNDSDSAHCSRSRSGR